MKECLHCKKGFEPKKPTRKFCSDSCRVMYHRKHGKQDTVSKVQMQVLYNSLMDKIEQMASQPISVLPPTQIASFNGVISSTTVTPKVGIKRTPAHWVELRRDCETADDYAKWLSDLDADQFLTTREKQQIKQTT